MKAQAACQPIDPLSDIAIIGIQLGEANSMFAPIKPPPSEDAAPQEAPVAAPAPAKASAKGAAAKAPAAAAAKGPAKGAAAAVDQAPPLGAPELGRAVELLGAQVHKYYTWREAATVYGLLPEAVTKDDLAGYRSLLSDIPQVCARIPTLRSSHKIHSKLSAHCSSKALCEAWIHSCDSGDSCVKIHFV